MLNYRSKAIIMFGNQSITTVAFTEVRGYSCMIVLNVRSCRHMYRNPSKLVGNFLLRFFTGNKRYPGTSLIAKQFTAKSCQIYTFIVSPCPIDVDETGCTECFIKQVQLVAVLTGLPEWVDTVGLTQLTVEVVQSELVYK